MVIFSFFRRRSTIRAPGGRIFNPFFAASLVLTCKASQKNFRIFSHSRNFCRTPCPVCSGSARGTGAGTRLGPTVVPQPLPGVLWQCPRHGRGHADMSHCCAAVPAARARARGYVQLLCPHPLPGVLKQCPGTRRAHSIVPRPLPDVLWQCPGTRLVPTIVPHPSSDVLRQCPGHGHAASSILPTLHTPFFGPRHRIFARFFADICSL